MFEGLKKELAEMLTDEDYVGSLTDVLAKQMLKSLKKAAKEEIEELKRAIIRNRKKLILGGMACVGVALIVRKLVRR